MCWRFPPAADQRPKRQLPKHLRLKRPPPTEAPAAEAPAPTFSGTATITFVQEPDNLNPMYTSMSFAGYLRPFYLKPSWDFDENGKPVPVLVKEIPSTENGGLSADGKTITLNLRDDVKWSDGEPLTADDYVFTFDMIMSDKNVPLGRYPYDDVCASVEAKDPTTVVINFEGAVCRMAHVPVLLAFCPSTCCSPSLMRMERLTGRVESQSHCQPWTVCVKRMGNRQSPCFHSQSHLD